VQFNDSGAFGGDANFTWNKIKDSLGIQNTNQQSALHVNSATGAALADVTVGSASLVAESLPAQASGSTSLIAELDAPTSPTASANYSGTGFTADNSTYDYQLTPYYTAGGVNYLSSNVSSMASFTDDNSTSPFSSSISWSASPNASGYKLERQIN